jgi:hypothetical protein
MKKRVRVSSSAEEEEEDGGGARAPEKANQFGQWLLENIYKYAEVRDSDALADVTKKHKVLSKRFDRLLSYVRVSGAFDDHWGFCTACGSNTVSDEPRDMCYSCSRAYVPCSNCGPEMCAAEKHPICFSCARLKVECNGRHPSWCTEPESDDE